MHILATITDLFGHYVIKISTYVQKQTSENSPWFFDNKRVQNINSHIGKTQKSPSSKA